MKKYIKVFIEIFYYLFIALYLLVMKNIYSTAVPADKAVFLSILCIVIGLFLLTGSKINKYCGLVLSFIYSLYLVAQKIYYRGFKSYFRFSTAIGLTKEVSEVKGAILELVHFEDCIPFIVLIFFTILFIVLHHVFQKKYVYKWYIRLLIVPLIILSVISVNNMEKDIEATKEWQIDKTDYYLYDTVNNPGAFVKKFGLLTYAYRDAEIYIFKSNNFDEYIKDIDEYYSNHTTTINQNEFTGLFEGKSVIIIQAESLMNIAISPELTPTLYQFMNEGIQIKNYDSPLLAGSTSDAEFMANTSMIPETDGYPICYQYAENTHPVTLGNLFKDNGYSTYAYHNNYAEYYNRNTTFSSYGYDFYDSYRLGLENLEADSTVSEQIAWMVTEKDKFAAYWITYSGHQPYTLDETGVREENVNKIKELYPDLDDSYVSYFAKQMDLDNAISHIYYDVMDWTGRMDDVVFVIIGDHTSKSINCAKGTNLDKVFNKNWEDTPEEFYTPCFIYAKDIEHVVVDKYMTALDIIPTLMNLWNIDYEKEYVFGNDIFDPNYDGFAFDSEGNYYNTNFEYNAVTNEIKTYNGYTEEKSRKLVRDFDKKRDICKKILVVDYFKK